MNYKLGNEKKQLVNAEIIRSSDNKRRELYVIFCFIFTISFLIVFYVWQRIENIELAYKIEDLKKNYEREKEINKVLILQMEDLTDLKRIESIAKTKLGMVSPNAGEIQITRSVNIKVENDDGAKVASLNTKMSHSRNSLGEDLE